MTIDLASMGIAVVLGGLAGTLFFGALWASVRAHATGRLGPGGLLTFAFLRFTLLLGAFALAAAKGVDAAALVAAAAAFVAVRYVFCTTLAPPTGQLPAGKKEARLL